MAARSMPGIFGSPSSQPCSLCVHPSLGLVGLVIHLSVAFLGALSLSDNPPALQPADRALLQQAEYLLKDSAFSGHVPATFPPEWCP